MIYRIPAPLIGRFRTSRQILGRGVKGLRLGVIRRFHLNDVAAAREIVAAIDTALSVLVDLGAELAELGNFVFIHTLPVADRRSSLNYKQQRKAHLQMHSRTRETNRQSTRGSIVCNL